MKDTELRKIASTLLSMLTIVIPTFGRPGRAMAKALYWAKRGCTVHVMDGSDSRDSLADADDNSRVTYHHGPGSTFANRIAWASELVDTPYVMLQPDDDVFLPGALESIISSLERDRAAVGASGVAVSVQKSGFGPNLVSIKYPKALERVQLSGKTQETLADFMRAYYPSVIYGVVRMGVFRKVLHELGGMTIDAYGMEELFFEMGVNGTGTVLALPEVYWIRNPSVPSMGQPPSRSLANQAQLWFHNPHSSDYQSFLTQLATALASSNAIKYNFAVEEAARGLEAYSEFFTESSDCKKYPTSALDIRPLAKRLAPKRLWASLSFFLKWLLSVTLPSKRRLEEAFPQPPFIFLMQARKEGIHIDKSTFLNALASLG